MEVNIPVLMEKYLKQTKANIIDANEMRVIIPVLLREIEALEKKAKTLEGYIERLQTKKPILERKGTCDKAQWFVSYDIKTNIIYCSIKGVFCAKSAKVVSNTLITLIDYTHKGYGVIVDIRNLEAVSDLKVLFHLKKVRYNLNQTGAGKVIRIVCRKNKVVSELFGKGENELTENVWVVETMDEAKAIIERDGSSLKV